MGHDIADRGTVARGALAVCAAALFLFAFAPAALAGRPTHKRLASLDVSGLNHACGTAVDSEGDVYAASAGEGKIKVFGPTDHTTPIAQISDANEPCALAVDNHGDLLVSEKGSGNVVMYVPDSYPLSGSPSYGAPLTIDASGQARGISVDPTDERLYVAEGDRVSTYVGETQELRIDYATGGTFTLRFEGEETAPLPYNASNGEIQAALEALPAIGVGGVSVSTGGGSPPSRMISFCGPLAYRDVPQVRILSSLEGNATQEITVKATTGTYTVRFEGYETAPIPFDAPANEGAGSLEAALAALPNLTTADLTVTGGPGDATGSSPYSVSFEGAWAATDIQLLQLDQSGLVGGTANLSFSSPGLAFKATTFRSGGSGVDEAQVVNVRYAIGGAFELSFEEEETAPLLYDADPEEVQAALEALPSVGAGRVSVFRTANVFPNRSYAVEFQGLLAHTNVEALACEGAGLTGPGTPPAPSCSVSTSTEGWSGRIGEGELTEATGVAAYNYVISPGQSPSYHHYVAVADAAGNELKVFAGKQVSKLKLRRTISGVDQDGDPETPEQGLGFGEQGAYLTADPGNEDTSTRSCVRVAEQACSEGHLYLYDAQHKALDEFDATGEFLDQTTNAGFADGDPTQVAIDRSGGAHDGAIYVSSGDATGAKLLAFAPLVQPSRQQLETPLSKTLKGAEAVDVDCRGYVYVGAESAIRVYSPEGAEVGSFEDANKIQDIAADCAGNVYVVDYNKEDPSYHYKLTYYAPSAYPPEAATYTRHAALIPNGSLEGVGMSGVAVDPTDGHVFVTGNYAFGPDVAELGSAGEGSAVVRECDAGLSFGTSGPDIDLYPKTGEIYLANNPTTLHTIRCGEEGAEATREILGDSCPGGGWGATPHIAVDKSNGHVLVAEPDPEETASAREYDASGACVAEFGTFYPDQFGNGYKVAVDSSCAVHEPPLGGQACKEFDPANGNVYVAYDAPNKAQPYDVNAFAPLSYGEEPGVSTGGADGIEVAGASLHGTVDPRGFLLEECAFQYLEDDAYEQNLAEEKPPFEGASSQECAESPAEIGKGSEAVSVHTDIGGIEPQAKRYRYRLVATNAYGESDGEAGLLGPPLLQSRSAFPVTYREATLRAKVDPSGLATTYRFQYLSEAEYEANGETFAGAKSTGYEELAAGAGPSEVQAPLFGLAEGTAYRFRVLVENEAASREGPVQSLTTLQRPGAQSCSNSEYRYGASVALPDCRAYELVTPAQTFTSPATNGSSGGGSFFNSFFVAPRGAGAGDSLLYGAGISRVDGTTFRSQRAPGTHPAAGWGAEMYGMTYAQGGGEGGPSRAAGGVSADQRYMFEDFNTTEVFETGQLFPLGHYIRVPTGEASRACAPEPKPGFEATDPAAQFELVGCGPLGADPQAKGRFLSVGGAHVVFSSGERLVEGAPAGAEELYDREAGSSEATLVSLLPAGTPVAAGEGLEYVATTEDGASVIFRADGNLYARRGGQTREVAAAPNSYAGVSEDGKRVFFVDANYGVSPAVPAGLYACGLTSGPCAGAGAHAPVAIAEEAIFVNVSADGSHAWFISEEGLTGAEENEAGETALEGERNLYAWDGSTVRFVAILASADTAGEGVFQLSLLQWTHAIPGQGGQSALGVGRAYSPTRSSPDGKVLVFQSHAELTGYDNEGHGEIYRYDPVAPAGQILLCVSCNPSGAPHAALADAKLGLTSATSAETLTPNVTDDGQRVIFESGDRLLPGDSNDLGDVYEWKGQGFTGPGGDTCTRPAGCLALISTGQAEDPSFLFGMSADGSDVFFLTRELLAGGDVTGSWSIYDAREGGGIPEPEAPAACEGDACQGQGTPPPALQAPASAGAGAGDLPAPAKARRCAKGERRVRRKGRVRCVARHHHERHRHPHRRAKHRTNHKGRAHR